MIATGAAALDRDSPDVPAGGSDHGAAGPFPLLINQERQLIAEEVLSRLGRTVPPFNVVDCMRLRGPVNEAVLEPALNALIERHGAFRMATRPCSLPDDVRAARLAEFDRTRVFEPGLYEQIVLPSAMLRLRRKRVPSNPEGKMRAVCDVLLEECAIPFRADGSPLVRARLLRDEQGDRLLVVTVPHFISDALSMRIFWDELAAIHDSLSTGLPADLPVQVRQQHDVAAWQHRLIADGALEDAARYWTEQWSSFEGRQIGCEDISFAKGRELSAGGGAGGEIIEIARDHVFVVRQAARTMRVTPFVLLFSAICLALRRWARSDCVTPWVTCANREMPGAERVVGWLMHSHMIGVDLRDAATGYDVVEACRAAIVGGVRYQALPLPVLWKRLSRSSEAADRRWIILDWYRRPPRLAPRLLQMEWVRVPGRRTQVPVGLSIKGLDTGAGLSIQMVYQLGLFAPLAVRWMLDCVEGTLVALARAPRQALDALVRDVR